MKEPLGIADNNPPENRPPDPWGVRRAEMLLQSLKGVQGARVVVSPDGEIKEIHVLTATNLTPKQAVRNIESALLAQLGIKVDYRRISVAQTAEVVPIDVEDPGAAAAAGAEGLEAAARGHLSAVPRDTPEPHIKPAEPEHPTPEGGAAQAPGTESPAERTSGPEWQRTPASGALTGFPGGPQGVPSGAAAPDHAPRSVLYRRVDVSSIKPNKVRVTVGLEYGQDQLTAAEDAADTPNMRLLAAARATVSALDEVVENGTLDLVGAQFVEAFDTTFVFVGVSVLAGRDTHLHTGTCEIRRGAEQAAALAVLDATNRWLRGAG